MKDKELFTGLKGKSKFKNFRGLQYWIAAVSYLVIVSLSIVCLAVYLPDLSGSDVLNTGTLTILKAMLFIILIFATAVFGWEMMQWHKGRGKKKQSGVEDILKDIAKDSNDK